MIKILIADDHALIRKALKDLLLDEFPHSEITQVNDAESLIKELGKSGSDLIITDISMPGRSGLDALEHIKELYPKIPVLVLSGHPEEQYALRVLRAGASGYLMKESAPEELITAVKRVFMGKKYITPSIADKLASLFDTKVSQSPHELLSNREFEVFKMLASGKTVSEIGKILFLGSTTISTYRSRIMHKMNFKNNSELIQYGIKNNMV